ncbi:hypothetical protein D3C73_1131980 [compost metagenome]
MFVGERQAIKTIEFQVHARQLSVVTDKLFGGCLGRGAIETGFVSWQGFWLCLCRGVTKARRHARADGEHRGQKWHDLFHFGVT